MFTYQWNISIRWWLCTFSDLPVLILTTHISSFPVTNYVCNVCPSLYLIMTVIYADDSRNYTSLLGINLHQNSCLRVHYFVHEMDTPDTTNISEIVTPGVQHIIELWGECPNVPAWVNILCDKIKPGGESSILIHIPCQLTFCVNSSPHGENGRHFSDGTFRSNFVTETFWILIKISLKFIPKVPIENSPALV